MRSYKIHIPSLTAAWFLALFLFIFTEKLLHGHQSAGHINKQQSHISIASSCAVCDFQSGRDAEITEWHQVVPVSRRVIVPSLRIVSTLHKMSFAISGDRGPPAMI